MKKQFHVEVYGKNDLLVEEHQFDTKKEHGIRIGKNRILKKRMKKMIKTNQVWQVGNSRFIIDSVGEMKSSVFVVSLGKTSSVSNTFFTRLGTLVWSDDWEDAN